MIISESFDVLQKSSVAINSIETQPSFKKYRFSKALNKALHQKKLNGLDRDLFYHELKPWLSAFLTTQRALK